MAGSFGMRGGSGGKALIGGGSAWRGLPPEAGEVVARRFIHLRVREIGRTHSPGRREVPDTQKIGSPEVGVGEIRASEIGLVKGGTREIRSLQIGMAENRAGRIGAMEVGTAKVRAGQIRFPEMGIAKVGAGEIGTGQVSKTEERPGERGPLQVRAVKIGHAEGGAGEFGTGQTGVVQIALDEMGRIAAVMAPALPNPPGMAGEDLVERQAVDQNLVGWTRTSSCAMGSLRCCTYQPLRRSARPGACTFNITKYSIKST